MPPSPPVLGNCLHITYAKARSDQKVCKQRHLTTTLIQRPLSSTTLLSRYWNVTVLDVTEAKDTGGSGDNSELVMGHFFKTQPYPTQNFWTQPNATHHRHLIWHIRLYRKLYTTTVTRHRQVHSTFYKPTVNESYYSAAVLIDRQ